MQQAPSELPLGSPEPAITEDQRAEAAAQAAAEADAAMEEAPAGADPGEDTAMDEDAADAAADDAAAADDGGDADAGAAAADSPEAAAADGDDDDEGSPEAAAAPAAPPAAAFDPRAYGAAAASLQDPACQPGTAAFEAAAGVNAEILAKYNKVKDAYERVKQPKADMKAAKEVRDPSRRNRHGHLPGIAVGAVFSGRGELDVLGLHGQAVKGIDCKKDEALGAYAIVLSGGYKDDEDLGADLWYTGAGGQEGTGGAKKQVTNQTFEHNDNAALVNNITSATPVRLFRGKAAAEKGLPPQYIYEGLYQVVEKRRVPSQDGPLVVQFKLRGVPGHSAVSAKVEFNSLAVRGAAFRRVKLAGASAHRGGKKRRAGAVVLPTYEAIRAAIQQRANSGSHGRLVTPDLSNGLETVPIPVWNDQDGCDTIHTMMEVPPDFPVGEAGVDDVTADYTYIADYEFGDDDAATLAILSERLFRRQWPSTCGIQFNGELLYNSDQLLTSTAPSGLMECDANCRSRDCRANRVLSSGIQYPLEVFKVAGKGWGVRCAVDMPMGAVACAYIGNIISDRLAEQLRGMDAYLFDLNHFHVLLADASADADNNAHVDDDGGYAYPYGGAAGGGAGGSGDQQQQQRKRPGPGDDAAAAAAAAGGGGGGGEEADRDINRNLPPLARGLQSHHLVVDASHEGNVARFINHCCDPNCLLQTVFAKDCRCHLLHYIAIVASVDIPAFTELTYDYAYLSGEDDEAIAAAAARADADEALRKRRLPCNCGAANCKKWLLLH